MQKITLEINNPRVEKTLLMLSKEQNKSVENIIIELLSDVPDEMSVDGESQYRTIDPDGCMKKIVSSIKSDENLVNKNVLFQHITDSGEYIKTIREKTWNRSK